MSNNLPVVGPNQKDIQEMARLRAIMNGGNVPVVHEHQAQYSGGHAGTRRPLNESYAPPPVSGGFAGQEDVNAMREVLARFKAAAGEDSAPRHLNENMNERVQHNFENVGNLAQTPAHGSFEVRISLSESSDGKEVKNHVVVDSMGQTVIGGLSLVESAKAVMKLLNKGLPVGHARITELTELDEDYNRNRILAGQARNRYQRSVELKENAAAEVFKARFETARATALATKDQIQSILESIR